LFAAKAALTAVCIIEWQTTVCCVNAAGTLRCRDAQTPARRCRPSPAANPHDRDNNRRTDDLSRFVKPRARRIADMHASVPGIAHPHFLHAGTSEQINLAIVTSNDSDAEAGAIDRRRL